MLELFRKGLKSLFLTIMGMCVLCTEIHGTEVPLTNNVIQSQELLSEDTYTRSWKKFHSANGKCVLSLPASPEHVQQVMPFSEGGYNLLYDLYISAHEKKAVYMLLIAQYPPFINETYAKTGLESFLNGLVGQHCNTRLIFADLLDVQGHQALDFFIELKGVYFKGRAIMAQNHLYLLAMECNVKNYLEKVFNYFINSFELIK